VNGLAIYQPSAQFPENIGIDGDLNNIFSWTVNGDAQTDFQLIIYNNADNTSVYDSTKITSVTPTHTVPTSSFTNNLELKWKVKIWHNSSYVDSDWVLFKSYTTPTVVMGATPTVEQNYTFSAVYNQAQGVSVKKYKFILYDNDDVIITDSDWIYSTTTTTPTTLSYAITGMTSATPYKIECQVYNAYDMYVTSGQTSFSVAYMSPDDSGQLVVTGINTTGAIQLDWTNVIQVLGVVTGSYAYVDPGKYNISIHLNSGSKIKFVRTVTEDFTVTYWIKLPTGFTGIFITLGNDCFLGYNGTKFYYQSQSRITAGVPRALPSDYFFVGIKWCEVTVIDIGSYTETFR
jgi:hypothetical protein